MTLEPKIALRLQFLSRVVRKECRHLVATDQRLFESGFTLAQASQVEVDPDRQIGWKCVFAEGRPDAEI